MRSHPLGVESGDPVIRGVRAEPVERLHEQLRESLQVLVTSEDWRQALAVAARFHDYSFANNEPRLYKVPREVPSSDSRQRRRDPIWVPPCARSACPVCSRV